MDCFLSKAKWFRDFEKAAAKQAVFLVCFLHKPKKSHWQSGKYSDTCVHYRSVDKSLPMIAI